MPFTGGMTPACTNSAQNHDHSRLALLENTISDCIQKHLFNITILFVSYEEWEWHKGKDAVIQTQMLHNIIWFIQYWNNFHTSTSANNPRLLWSITVSINTASTSFYLRSIKPSNGIICISGIVKLQEGKSRWVSGHPNIFQWSIVAECPFNFFLRCISWQVTNIYLAI